jgi:uncharacterized protein YndB with AHSA1/START domain
MMQKHAKISSDAVLKRTGKSWAQWIALLDIAGATKMTHQQIVALLHERHGVGPWWQQMLTVGYEQAHGLRVKHQRPDGFSINRSKTIVASVEDLFAAWQDRRRRKKWLADVDFTIRKSTKNKSLRITWIDGETKIEVQFYDKGKGKSQVTIQHSRLSNTTEAETMKRYWGDQLEKLKAMLEQ